MTSFREYLDQQPLARKREILAAQRRYLEGRRQAAATEGSERYLLDPLTEAFTDSMFGYEDPPPYSGPRR